MPYRELNELVHRSRLGLAQVGEEETAIRLWDVILPQGRLSQPLTIEQMHALLIGPVQVVKKRGQAGCHPTDQQMIKHLWFVTQHL